MSGQVVHSLQTRAGLPKLFVGAARVLFTARVFDLSTVLDSNERLTPLLVIVLFRTESDTRCVYYARRVECFSERLIGDDLDYDLSDFL